jgi:hypothetical protein
MNKVLQFSKQNYKMIIKLILILFLLYWIIYVLTPMIKMSELSVYKIQDLQKQISNFEINQKKMDSLIVNYTEEIHQIEGELTRIKSEKTVIKEIYHEEINRVDSYNDRQLDSFFAKRYGYYPR